MLAEEIRIEEKEIPKKKNTELKAFDMLVMFGMPMLVGKCFILYFGARYSNEPGEGYGYYLCASIAFTIFMVAKFLWKYRNYVD